MENKYITVAYKLYAVTDGEKELREEAPASPFNRAAFFNERALCI